MRSNKSNPKQNKTLNTPPAEPLHQWNFEAIGTAWWIGVYQPLGPQQFTKLQQAVATRIDHFDKTYSRFRADSWVTKISESAGTYTFPSDAEPLFKLYRSLYDITGGLVTPLIGQTLADTGYDATYSLMSKKLHKPPVWEQALDMSANTLTVKMPVLLDFGAAGKGYLVDILTGILAEQGVGQFCIDASGDIRCHVLAPLKIGLEHPDDPGQAIGVATIVQGALCGSASNRRTWGKYHHIMNPATLESVQRVKAVWVTAADALTADGLATALFFADPAELHKHFTFAHCIVYSDNTIQYSTDFPAEFFS